MRPALWRRVLTTCPAIGVIWVLTAWLALGAGDSVKRNSADSLLPEDPRYIGLDLAAIRSAIPGLERWLAKVFTVMGGFMAGAGVLTLHLALTAIPRRVPATAGILAITGVVTVGLMSAVNFVLASDFRWLLVAPVILWASGTALYAFGPPDREMARDPV